MGAAFLFTLLVVIIVALFIGAVRGLVRSWQEYQLRLRLLEQLESHPEWIHSEEAVESAMAGPLATYGKPSRHNYALTGGILAVIGLGCIIIGHVLRVGQIAVGLYAGGQACVAIGLVLLVLGLSSRFLVNRSR